MALYLAFDGGGTKSQALLFDDDGPIGSGKSGGTNTTFSSREECRANIEECLDEALCGVEAPVIDTVYAVIVGPFELLEVALRQRAAVGRFEHMGEGQAGVLAGLLLPWGLVAISGTGSGVCGVSPEGDAHRAGGYGYLLGDEGSGTWIGQQALRKAIAYGDGWGEPTIFREMIYERWGLSESTDIISAVHGTVAPFRKVASCVPIVAEAARLGDKAALAVFEEAGRLIAAQMLAFIGRIGSVLSTAQCTCCGGVWKAHPRMYEVFVEEMAKGAPEIAVVKPVFEHVMAGIVLHRMRAQPGESPQMLREALQGPYASYRITW